MQIHPSLEGGRKGDLMQDPSILEGGRRREKEGERGEIRAGGLDRPLPSLEGGREGGTACPERTFDSLVCVLCDVLGFSSFECLFC